VLGTQRHQAILPYFDRTHVLVVFDRASRGDSVIDVVIVIEIRDIIIVVDS
jgi:hypothetical protein